MYGDERSILYKDNVQPMRNSSAFFLRPSSYSWYYRISSLPSASREEFIR